MTDWELIRKFVNQDSQEAFTELRRRYTAMVYCTCLRELGEPALAEDAAQAVFLILARKASALQASACGATLAGWLFQVALLTSKNALRQERRRQTREDKAAQMEQLQRDTAAVWTEAEALLNEALRALPARQRALILERFFQERPLAEIGAGRGISEDAARMRVNRALERLRRFFAARNVTLSVAALAAFLPETVRHAPAHCAEAIQRLDRSASSPSLTTNTLAQGAIHAMNMKRLRLQFAAFALVAALSLGTVGAVSVTTQVKTHIAIAEKQRNQTRALAVLDHMYAAYAAMHSFQCNVTSREEPLHTAQDSVYIIERPNKIRFHRVTLIGPDMSGEARAVSDGHDLYVTCTENKGLEDRYAKMNLSRPDNRFWFSNFGGLPAWGTEPDAGMPDVALGIKLHETPYAQLSAPVYSLGQPTVIDFPGIALPVSLDVVIARMHFLTPIGTMQDDPEIVTYYIGQHDHLLYQLTAAYKISPTEWDTRTETYNSIEVDQKADTADFVFTPPPGSHEVGNVSDLFPGGKM